MKPRKIKIAGALAVALAGTFAGWFNVRAESAPSSGATPASTSSAATPAPTSAATPAETAALTGTSSETATPVAVTTNPASGAVAAATTAATPPAGDPAADPTASTAATGTDAAASASSDTSTSGTGGTSADAPAFVAKPREALIMARDPVTKALKATQSLVLGIVNSGAHLFAVGEYGTILVSNNGTDWSQVIGVPVRAALTAITFPDKEHGYAVGHDASIVATTDGGKTWKLQNFQPEKEKPFLDVLCTDATNCVAVGAYGLLMKTSDGGQTWADVDAKSIRADETHFNAIRKLGNGQLLIVGEAGMVAVSPDGGTTWEKLSSPYESSFFGAQPVGDAGAVIYGLRGNVFITQDVRSAVWTKIDTKSEATFFNSVRLANGDIVLVGLRGEIVRISATDGSVKSVRAKRKDMIGGKETEREITGTYAAVIPWKDGLVLGGEQGINQLGAF